MCRKVFVVQGGVTATISNLTVQNGNGNAPPGSGIENHGILTLSSMAVVNNGVGGGSPGGGIYNSGNAQLTLQQSLVANNVGQNGGGLEMNNGVTMQTSRSLGTRALFGAIFSTGFVGWPHCRRSMLNVTITQNTATLATAGGGISWGNADPLTVRDTIVANNQPKNCAGTFTSQGNNLEDTNTCNFNQPGDLANTPAGLDPAGLKDNGGPTQTVRILNTSAAFNGVTCGAPARRRRRTSGASYAAPGPALRHWRRGAGAPGRRHQPDGIVDVRDYGVWRTNFGQTNCGNPADLDGNCIVDIRDYGIWRMHFGEVASDSHGAGPRPRAPARETRASTKSVRAWRRARRLQRGRPRRPARWAAPLALRCASGLGALGAVSLAPPLLSLGHEP